MRWLVERLVKLAGWRFVGELPDDSKLIIIGAPHTSNWDFILFLAAISHWDMHPRYLAKHTLLEGIFGWLFRRWGGIPVDRAKPGGIVGQVKTEFERATEIVLVMAPEGTRAAAPHWKSGFLSIASATGAPLVPAKISGQGRTVTLGRPIRDVTSIPAAMEELRNFFADAEGIRPTGVGPATVRETDLDQS